MPSQSITLDQGQYQYILETKEPDQSISGRVRELVDTGIEQEKNEQ